MARLDVRMIVFSHYPPRSDDVNGTLRRLAAEAEVAEAGVREGTR